MVASPLLARSCALFACLSLVTGCKLLRDEPVIVDPGGGGQSDWCDGSPAPVCDSSIVVAPDSPALLVTDPAVLAKLPLQDVLDRLLEDFNDPPTPREQLLRMLFDSNNNHDAGVFSHDYHCDDEENPAHANGSAGDCPRAEGALALSDGFFTPGHPDHFYPVAIVDRIDLMPLDNSTCGEFRIVYAKESGKTDPDDRVFLIFEAALPNPEPWCEHSCRPVAEFWKSLEGEESARALGDRLRQFFLEGIPGFDAAIRLNNFGGSGFGGSGYYGANGQVRVSQHIDEHWELREFSYRSHWLGPRFEPKFVGNNPMPHLFRAYYPDDAAQLSWFEQDFVSTNVELLGRKSVSHQGMITSRDDLAGESEQGGDKINDYALVSKENTGLRSAVDHQISVLGIGDECPPDDPLDAEAILRRATMQSCAGCHAPSRFLGPERAIGCGVTWPDSLGDVHIDEHGDLSPALRDVFLPHRAEVLTTYLQGCDPEAIEGNIGGPFGTGAQTKALRPGATLGGSVTH